MSRTLFAFAASMALWSSVVSGATDWSAADYDLYPGDFDGDGKADLLYVAKAPSGASGIARSDGNSPAFSTQTWLSNHLGIPWHSNLYAIVVEDFNGDGKSDVFMQRRTPGDHYLLFADQNGGISSISQTIPNSFLGLSWSGDEHGIHAGDFNNDGRADLFLQGSRRNSTHAVVLASSTGQLTAGPHQTWTDASWGTFAWSAQDAHIFVGDFNGDGRSDLLVQAKPQIVLIDYEIPIPVPTYRPGMNGVALSQGGSSPFQQIGIQQWNRTAFGADWSPSFSNVVIADFDGNGTSDVLLQARRSGTQSYILGGNPSGAAFASASVAATNVSWSADGYRLVAGNFDGVGGAGLFWQAQTASGTNYFSNAVSGGTVSLSTHTTPAPAPIIPATVAGRIEGAFAVSSHGAATYTVPIWTAPGPRGMQPNLALTYNSHQENGVLGVGWSLSGLSSIERCNRTKAQDGAAGSITLTLSDRFCLNGRRLVSTGAASYGQPDSTYQTEVDDLTVVTAYESLGNGPKYFKARTRDGFTYEYGNSDTSRAFPGTATTPFRWKLNRVTDPAGNNYVISYVQAGGHALPDTISWTPTSHGSTSYLHTAKFIYSESRTAEDSQVGYVANHKVENKRRLESIQIRSAASGVAQTIRRYFLTYETGVTTKRSRLIQITECADDQQSACLATTTVTYHEGSSGSSSSTTALASSTSLKRGKYDFNGDGRHDLLFVSSGTWRVAFAVDGGFAAAQNTTIPSSTTPIVGRFTAERHDALIANISNVWWHYAWNNSTSAFQGANTSAPVSSPMTQVADTNADGLSDLVWITSGQVFTRLNSSSSAATSPTFATSTSLAATVPLGGSLSAGNDGGGVRFSDVDGDGRQDLYLYYPPSLPAMGGPFIPGFVRILLARDTTFEILTNIYGIVMPVPLKFNDDACTDRISGAMILIQQCGDTEQSIVTLPQTPLLTMDWNGDGRADFMVPNGSTFGVYLSLGNGVSALEATSVPYAAGGSYFAADQDGDGLDDVVRVKSTSPFDVSYYTRAASGSLPAFLAKADLAASFTDGFGVTYQPGYISTARPNNSPFSGAFPPRVSSDGLQDDATARTVVGQVTASDGTGGQYNTTYEYLAARRNVSRSEFAGYGEVIETDGRNGTIRKTWYEQAFPVVGMIKEQEYLQADGTTKISRVTYDNRAPYVQGATDRYFVYVHGSVSARYEVGGDHNGELIALTNTTNTISPTLGVLTDSVSRVVEATTANGMQQGTEHVTELHHLELFDDPGHSCRGMPQRTQLKKTSSRAGSVAIIRESRIAWAGQGCRPQSSISAPGTEWQVTSVFDYDDFGNIDQVTATPASSEVRISKASWGVTGQFPEQVRNAKNDLTQLGWNRSLGVRTSAIDPNGLITHWYPDQFGRIVQESRPDGTRTQGTITACTSSNQYCGSAQSTVRLKFRSTTYDVAGGQVRSDDQYFDAFERLRYDDRQMSNGLTSRSITAYDAFGRVRAQSVPHTLNSGDPLGNTEFGYDLVGRLTSVSGQVSETDTSIATTRIDYLGLTEQTTRFHGDPSHQRITSVVRDALGQVIQASDAVGSRTRYEYDVFGNLLKVRNLVDANNIAANEVVMEYYDAIGLKKKIADPDMGTWEYKYYPFGELKEQKNANLQVTSFTYDKLSRPLTRSDSTDGQTAWVWDTADYGKGQLDHVTSPGGYKEEYLYDNRGRVRQQAITIDATQYTYQFDYNSTGLLNSITYPTSTSSASPFKVRYGYAYGLMTSVQDYTGNASGTTYWQATASNARGQITHETFGNELQTVYDYDRIAGWLDSQTTGPSGSNTIQNLSYEWYKTGSLKNRRDLKRNLTEAFVYDTLGRLDGSTLSGAASASANYDYDEFGNLTMKTGVGEFKYEHEEKPHAVTSTVGAVNNTYEYDANGNMTKRNGATTTWYTYDLPKSIASANSTSEFWYGPDRARWKQRITTGSAVETWTYIGGLMEKKVVDGTTEYRHLIRGAAGTVAIHTRGAQSSTYYVARDHLGGANAITNSAGVELVNASFDAFGQRRGSNWTGVPSNEEGEQIAAVSSRGFTDHEHLDNLNLIHMNGRVYDPQIGRFTSADPYVQDPSSLQSFNRYSYTFNDPLSNVDPSGFTCSSWYSFSVGTGGGGSPDDYGPVGFGFSSGIVCDRPARPLPSGPRPNVGGEIGDSTVGGSLSLLSLIGISSATAQEFTEDEIEADVYTRQRLGAMHQDATIVADAASFVAEEGYKWEAGGKIFAALAAVRWLPHTRQFFRLNLIASTGKNPGPQWIAHHGLPVEFEKAFNRLGVKNIHDPKWGIWTPSSMHVSREWHGAYNARWRAFLSTNPSAQDIERQWRFQKWLIEQSTEIP